MGLFNKFKNNDYELICEKMGKEFVSIYIKEKGVPFENITELERQILAVYFFGMADGLRQNTQVDKNYDEVSKIIINILIEIFKYSKENAEQFFDSMIDNLHSKELKNTQYIIIHRGLDGYFEWKKDNKNDVVKDVCQIINKLK